MRLSNLLRASVIATLATGWPSGALVRAESIRLSPEGREVVKYQISPDGLHAVYLGDGDTSARELFSVPVDGGTILRLNDPLTPGKSVVSFEVGRLGSRVAYCADEADDLLGLHSAYVQGGGVVDLAQDEAVPNYLCSVGSHFGPRLNGDGSRVVYVCRRDHPGFDPDTVCSVPIQGGPEMSVGGLSGITNPSFPFSQGAGSLDGRWMPYSFVCAAHQSECAASLNVVSGGLKTVAACNGLAGENCDGYPVAYTGDSQRVLWFYQRAAAGGTFTLPLVSANLVGSGSVVLNEAPSSLTLAISPSRIGGQHYATFGALEVSAVDGDPDTLSFVYPGTAQNGVVFSPDASLIVFVGNDGLYVAPSTESNAYSALSTSTDVPISLRISPDGAHVVFRTQAVETRLYSIPIVGGTPVLLSPPGGGPREGYLITSDSRTVVYTLSEAGGGAEIYAVPITGGEPLRLSEPPAGPTSITDVQLDGTNRRVLYRGREAGSSVWQLYSAPLDTDRDGDGVLDSVDCQPDDDLVGSPAMIDGLMLTPEGGTQTRLAWNLADAGGAGPVTFETLRATERDAFSVPGGSFVAIDTGADTVSTDDDPVANIFYYVVRAVNGCGSFAGDGHVGASDQDGDGIADAQDPCPTDGSTGAADADGDGVGDPCDVCPGTFDADQADADLDGIGDACDNCRYPNADQHDGDGDGIGDACICSDVDGDGVCQAEDNCPAASNPAQTNGDGDAYGDACDPCPTVSGTTCPARAMGATPISSPDR